MLNPCPCQSQSQIRGFATGGIISAYKPPSLEEQHKAADAALYDAREEALTRQHAVGLAVKASDGSRDDLLALAPLFEAWGYARKTAQAALDHREAIARAMKEAASNG